MIALRKRSEPILKLIAEAHRVLPYGADTRRVPLDVTRSLQ
jgi:hypothetical protein